MWFFSLKFLYVCLFFEHLSVTGEKLQVLNSKYGLMSHFLEAWGCLRYEKSNTSMRKISLQNWGTLHPHMLKTLNLWSNSNCQHKFTRIVFSDFSYIQILFCIHPGLWCFRSGITPVSYIHFPYSVIDCKGVPTGWKGCCPFRTFLGSLNVDVFRGQRDEHLRHS